MSDDRDYDYPSTDLRPCPFCGGEATFGVIEEDTHPDFGGHFIQCTEARCEASSALRFAHGDDPKPLLAEQWNRRAVGVPEGWKIVPVEPTPEMIRASFDATAAEATGKFDAIRRALWKAMVAAAQPRADLEGDAP